MEASYTSVDTGLPDIRVVPDSSTWRVLPWRPGTAFMMCDCLEPDGSPVAVAPRTILTKVVERARTMGYEPHIGAELEFYLFDPAAGQPDGDRIPCYSLHEESRYEPVIAAIRNQLAAAGVLVKGSNTEYAPGQFEVNLHHTSPVEAADATMLLRYAVRQVAEQHGLVATFMGKPFSHLSGSGLHVHQSLWGDENLFASGEQDFLAPLALAYVGGLVAHMADLAAIGAPNPNAYKRRVEDSFAPVNATWGLDNRTVGVRVPTFNGPGARVEQRDAAADANPYLVIACQLAAGLDGIERNLVPGPMVTGNAYTDTRSMRLPETLQGALARFEASALARDVCGEAFHEIFVALARRELDLERAAVTDWERRRYLQTS